MQTHRYKIPQADLAARLRRRRIAEDLTQKQAGEAAQIARTTLIAIEQGKRPASPAELQRLAYVYRTSASLLLARGAGNVELAVQFRRCHSFSRKDLKQACCLLERMVEADLRFESILGLDSSRSCSFPEFSGRDSCRDEPDLGASNDAGLLRRRLKIGLSPVHNIPELIECGLDMRLYVSHLVSSEISGLWASSSDGACMLLNASHAIETVNYSAAHELGHFVWSLRQRRAHRQQEAYADSFADSFLMPEPAVRARAERLQGESSFTMRSLAWLAGTFNVPRAAMAHRLHSLGIIKKDACRRMQDEDRDSAQPEGRAAGDALCNSNQYKLQRIYRLAIDISEKGLLSEGQLSRLLCLDRLELREILYQ